MGLGFPIARFALSLPQGYTPAVGNAASVRSGNESPLLGGIVRATHPLTLDIIRVAWPGSARLRPPERGFSVMQHRVFPIASKAIEKTRSEMHTSGGRSGKRAVSNLTRLTSLFTTLRNKRSRGVVYA